MEIYRSRFCTTEFDVRHSLLKQVWFRESQFLTDSLYQKEILIYAEYLNEFSPTKTLTNLKDFYFIITPFLQSWHMKTVDFYVKSVKKNAIIMSVDLFTQVSVQQTLDENIEIMLFTRYFSSEEEAMIWILK